METIESIPIPRISIHWLHSQEYCEYSIYLEYVKGIEIEPTSEMELGREVHTVLEKDHRKKAKLKLRVSEALSKSQKEKVVLVGREIPVVGTRLIGLTDEVHFRPDQIVVEVKAKP